MTTPLHPEALTEPQRRILHASSAPATEWGAYLAGGSAVALYLGHRLSEDFDWFAPKATPPTKLLEGIRSLGRSITVTQNDEGTFLGLVDGVKISVFRYRYPLIDATVSHDGCSIASVCDLAAMKLVAITQRTTKRDYVDIHALMTAGKMSLYSQVGAFHAKYPKGDPALVVRALGHFADVEKEQMPMMIARTTWPKIKADLTRALERFDLARALRTKCVGADLPR
jgi:hypothetical protein